MKILSFIFSFTIFLLATTTQLSCNKEINTSVPSISTSNEPETNVSAVDEMSVDDRANCVCPYYIGPSGTCPKYRIQIDLYLNNANFVVCGAAAVNSSTNSECLTWKKVSNTSNVIGFGDYGLLRTVLGLTSTTAQAHHIIPQKLCNGTISTGGYYQHPVVFKAAYDGFNPNDGYNGLSVPSAQHTPGGHANYTAWVEKQLNEYQMSYSNATYRQANTWLQCKLIPKLRIHLAAAIASGQTLHAYFLTVPYVFVTP
jgi:A nuclease family of the HNH/ENDO VII superfamily with conserved AHH